MTTLAVSPASTTGKKLDVPLSKLIASRNNPRKVKPERDAHRRMVASLRAHGLLQPLLVQSEGQGRYLVIAGNRRLAALREIFKGRDPKIACILKQVESDDAYAAALAENFAREPMHPLDEAEAFARLAKDEGQGADDIASQFGVTPGYVRQRMKLAALADVLKAAYRDGTIDTGMAEAFAAVPEAKQLEVWRELHGHPQHAEHVRNVIANAWIDSGHALFDIATVPPESVSRDLFGDRTLIERQAFFAAQAEVLIAQQKSLQEEGWSEVVLGSHNDLHDRLWRMDEAPVSYDEEVTKKLAKLEKKRDELEAKWDQIEEGDQDAADALQEKLDKLDEQAEALMTDAPTQYAEPVKAVGTAFLILSSDGQVRREYRLPRSRGRANSAAGTSATGDGGPVQPPAPPTPNDVSDKQTATLFTHQALAVREALLDNALARKRVLVLILHPSVRSEALAVKHDTNGTTVHADNTDGFTSPALAALRAKRQEIDPFHGDLHVQDDEAYARLTKLSEAQLDELIALLTVEAITAHTARRTELVCRLADDLSVNVRSQWRPDSPWLGCYQKFQLAALIGTLRGPAYGSAAEKRKKSELVAQATALFADAAEGRLTTDPDLAARVNSWLPAGVFTDAPEPPAEIRQAA